MAQPKVNPEHFRYIIFDTTHASYNGRKTAANNRSKEIVPGNILSVVESDDGLEALIKIPGADPAWQAANVWSAVEDAPNGILKVYTTSNHDELLDLLHTGTNWSKTRGEII